MPIIPGTQRVSAAPGEGHTVRLDRVTVKRASTVVLKDISLELWPGEMVAIVGRSGVGKSTLMGTLNGLLIPSEGNVVARGIGDLTSPRALQAHRLRAATVFQEGALVGRLNALENVLLGLAGSVHPLSFLPFSRAQKMRALVALRGMDLAAHALTRVEHLSGGERQRVGIARALVRCPQLLLADEPFASVDSALTRSLADQFRRLVLTTRLTAVLVVHQLETARTFADRIIGLSEGRIAFDGPASLFDQAAECAVFGSRAPCGV